MDSFAWATVSQSAALAGRSAVSDAGGGALLPSMLGFQLPPAAGLGHFSVDSGLVERAVRLSCFGAGNGATTTAGASNITGEGPFGHCGDHENAEPELGGGGHGHDDAPSAGAEAGDCSFPGPDSNKRKRSNEGVLGTVQDQAKVSNASTYSANGSARSKGNELEEDDGPAAAATGGKKKGKGAKEPDEPGKEGYIHVRARKGQATNRHSLAERLRREKISERMKLLQDLVPGCSKVTGKAVMLDEIINYVQSLQRHVEFLSMKLATVSPALNLNIEGLLSKNRLSRFPRAALSAPIGFSFSQETMPEPQLLSQSGMLQRGVHDMGNGPDVFRTVMQEQLNEKDLYRDAASQMPHTLDGSSFHDVAQMGYRSVIGSEDLSVRGDQDGFHM